MNNDVTASIGARITDFTRKMKQVTNSIQRIPNRVSTTVTARTDDFNNRMDNLANKIRVVGTVSAGVFKGGMLATLPAIVPVIASLTGAIGGMSAALAAAGTGAVAFGAVATSALNDVFEANKNIKKLREELANTTDMEKRAEILAEIKRETQSLTAEQQRGLTALQSFSKFWGGFAKQFEKPVMDIFIRSLGQVRGLIERLQPAFQGAVEAFNGLSESMGKAFKAEDMQKFFDFINANAGPAITAFGTAFGNIMRGIMNLMTAFGTSSLDMQGGLVKLTEKFANWSKTLSESKGFQNFITYVKENGPKVMALIGNITTFLIELGKGMAPLGTKVLDLVNGFLSWSNEMMKAHPLIAKIMGIIASLSGVLLALTPVIILVKSAFGGMATLIWTKTALMRGKVILGIKMMIQSLGKFIAKMAVMTAQMIAQSAKFIARWALMGAKSLLHAAKVAAAFVVAMGPVGWVIATVVALVALIIANWDKVKSWTQKAWSATVNFVKDAWSKIWGKTKEIASAIWNWVKDKFQATKQAISDAMSAAWQFISNIWGNIKTYITDKAQAIWSAVTTKFQQIRQAISNALSAAWSFISNIWGRIKTFISDKATAIWKAVKDKFQDMKDAISDKLNSAWEAIENIWGNVMDFFRGIDLFEIGGNIIQGLVDGIKSIDIIGAVKGIAGSIKDGFVDFFQIGSPSKLMKNTVGKWIPAGIGKGMTGNIKAVTQAAKDVAKAAVPKIGSVDVKRQLKNSVNAATSRVQASVETSGHGQTVNNYYATIDAKSVKEFNDVVRVFDPQNLRRG